MAKPHLAKKKKRQTNDLQNTTQKSEDRETLTPTKILGELRCFEGGKQLLLHMSFMDSVC